MAKTKPERRSGSGRESETIQRTVLWRRLDQPGAEYCQLRSRTGGWRFESIVLVALEGIPMRVSYSVVCDAGWSTRQVVIHQGTAAAEEGLSLTVDTALRWWAGTDELPELRGCLDVDLGITPATNTLPIRRRKLAAGESADVTAAWVRFPELSVERLPQRYTRLDQFLYRYESSNGGFVADISVDDLGLVTRYGDFWLCEALS